VIFYHFFLSFPNLLVFALISLRFVLNCLLPLCMCVLYSIKSLVMLRSSGRETYSEKSEDGSVSILVSNIVNADCQVRSSMVANGPAVLFLL
jgi:hypothetical protein